MKTGTRVRSWSRRFAFSAALLFAIVGVCIAQSTVAETSPLTPAAIKEFFDSHKFEPADEIWTQLGLCEEHAEPTGSCSPTPEVTNFCSEGCLAVLFQLDIHGAPGEEIAVRVCEYGPVCRLLVFRRLASAISEERWLLLEHFDSLGDRYLSLEPRAVSLGGKKWLAVAGSSGGSGLYHQYATWYEFAGDQLVKVLGVTEQYTDMNRDPVWRVNVQPQSYRRVDSAELLEFRYHVVFNRFHSDLELPHLWEESHKVMFARDEGQDHLLLDPTRSELGEEFRIRRRSKRSRMRSGSKHSPFFRVVPPA